jgi:4-amino-4-deoxy-L-arabinose transferase-like glycosyltransferase
MRVAFSTAAARAPAMPAQFEFSSPRWRRTCLAWMNGIEDGWAIPLLLIGFVAIWQAYFVIAYSGGDLHPDVLETWTLGRRLAWGYAKHPPLMGWVARAWTSFFPLENWSFQLMALTNSAIALWMIDLIARRFVRGDKRMIVLLLLMLTPTYQFHAERFNANAILLATWPLATYGFLRSFETRKLGWAIAAGAAAALAMLGKYYSVFLLASFGVAAILHPQRRAYFGSIAPWASIAAGLAALAPHLHWLAVTGAPPFAYALEMHAGKAFSAALADALLFIPGMALALLLPMMAWVLIAGRRLKRLPQDFRNLNPQLWLLFLVSIGTIVFPAVTSLALQTDMPPIWGLQGLFLVIILIVCGAGYAIERASSETLAASIIGISVAAAAVAAPLHAIYRNFHPLHEGRNFYRLAAEELTRQWRSQTKTALRLAGGRDDLAFALAFYSPDHPTFELRLVNPDPARPPDATDVAHGWAALCFGEDKACVAAIESSAARARRIIRADFDFQLSLFGEPGAKQRFTAIMVPPAAEPEDAEPSFGVSQGPDISGGDPQAD